MFFAKTAKSADFALAGSGQSVRFNFEGNLPEITKIKSGIGQT